MTTKKILQHSDEDDHDMLIVTLKLKSGRFESSIHVPLIGTEDSHRAFIESWLTMMENGLRIGQSSRKKTDEKSI